MIHKLTVHNYVLIDHLEIEFSDKLNVITGETGAGKSILLGAIGLILGNRADTKVLYNESEKCYVEGVFECPAELRPLFEEEGLDFDEELTIRREITPNGKSRAFANDNMVNLGFLQKISEKLVDLHQQFDTLDIQSSQFQLNVLDALAGNTPLLTRYKSEYQAYLRLQKELNELTALSNNAQNEADFLNFQLEELSKLNPVEGELPVIEQRLTLLNNSETIKKNLGNVHYTISDSENSVNAVLREVLSQLNEVRKYHPDIEQQTIRLEGLFEEMRDISGEIEDIYENTDHDEAEKYELQQRTDLYYRQLKKHNLQEGDGLVSLMNDISEKLSKFSSMEQSIADLTGAVVAQKQKILETGAELSAKRSKVAPHLQKETEDKLAYLGMENAKIEVELTRNENPAPDGLDKVSFLFSANKGSRLQPIHQVASGGELSRLALCIKTVVAHAMSMPTLIFDEIDSGVSGEVALKMGLLLNQLSRKHQVITITHSAQVASQADTHYFVYKHDVADRTITRIKSLNDDEKLHQLAITLSGNPPTQSALQNARELMQLKK